MFLFFRKYIPHTVTFAHLNLPDQKFLSKDSTENRQVTKSLNKRIFREKLKNYENISDRFSDIWSHIRWESSMRSRMGSLHLSDSMYRKFLCYMPGNKNINWHVEEHGFCYEINQDRCETNSVRCNLHPNSQNGCGRPGSCPPGQNGNSLFFFPAPGDQWIRAQTFLRSEISCSYFHIGSTIEPEKASVFAIHWKHVRTKFAMTLNQIKTFWNVVTN